MDLITIKGAYDSLKASKSLLNSLYKMKIDEEVKEQIGEIKEKLGTTQDSLFEIREELFKLQNENNELKHELKHKEDWSNTLNKYALIRTEGDAVVYKSNFEPSHYVCPSCISKKEIEILQDLRTLKGHFQCSSCKSLFPFKKKREASF